MKCLVVSPEKTVLDIEAKSVVLPLVDGEYGVMPKHTPVIARLGAGELRIEGTDGQTTRYFVAGGFVEVLDDVIALLTMHIVPEADLNIEQTEKSLQEALGHSANTVDLAQLKERRIYALRARLRMARRSIGE